MTRLDKLHVKTLFNYDLKEKGFALRFALALCRRSEWFFVLNPKIVAGTDWKEGLAGF